MCISRVCSSSACAGLGTNPDSTLAATMPEQAGDRRHRRPRLTVTIGSIKTAVAMLALTCGTLVFAQATSAGVITVPLSDFVIFSGGNGAGSTGGNQTSIGGHTHVIGNIGSNENLFQQGNPLPGYPAQLDGSAYAGGTLTFGQDLSVGDSLHLRQIVANGAATISSGVTIWGTVDASSVAAGSSPAPVITGGVTAPSSTTFGLVAMPAATVFTAGGANQTVPTGQGNSLTLAPGTYGALNTSSQNQAVILSSGNYYFDSIATQGGFDLEIDLTSGNPVNIYVVGGVSLAGQQSLLVKGLGTSGAYVPINQAPSLAGLIYLETRATFDMGGGVDATHNIWGGTVYASVDVAGNSPEMSVGQYTDWYGAAYAYDSFGAADHGTWNHVTLVPEPSAYALMSVGTAFALILSRWRHRRAEGKATTLS